MSKERPIVPDNSPKPGTEEFRKAKEIINQEGWEDNAAVVVGTKEEVETRTEQLIEGRETVDLRTYIHRNSVTEVESGELMGDEFKKYAGEDIMETWESLPVGSNFYNGKFLIFKSRNGDIKKVEIINKEITGCVEQTLGNLGFINVKHRDKINDFFTHLIARVKQFREIKRRKENSQEFEF